MKLGVTVRELVNNVFLTVDRFHCVRSLMLDIFSYVIAYLNQITCKPLFIDVHLV